MTAGQQASHGSSAAAGAAKLYTVTTDAQGLYYEGGPGALAPTTYGGLTMNLVGSSWNNFDFWIRMFPPTPPIDFFTKIEVLDSLGVWRTFYSNAAQYAPAETSWYWGPGGGNLVWPGAGTFPFRIYPGK